MIVISVTVVSHVFCCATATVRSW